jgi:carbonic anhydrase
MCEQHQHSLYCGRLGRRNFLKVTGSATALGIFGGGFLSEHAYADALTKAQRDEMSPSEIIDVMKKGNERFRSGVRQNRNYLNEQKASASGQYPAAVWLSCIDSRAPAEVIMDLGLGDIFNCRVAGNVANPDILGSMEFACKLAGAKVVLCDGAYGVWRNQRSH